MKLQTKEALLAGAIALTLALTACAPGFETAGTCAGAACAAKSESGETPADGSNGGSTPSPGWDAISLEGAVNGGRFDKAKAVEIDRGSKTLIVRVPFIAGIQIGVQAPLPIPEIPGSTIGVEGNPDGTSSLVLRIPLAKVLSGVDSLPIGRLPNGDALPAIPEGELPSVGLSVGSSARLKGALYLSPSVVGLFIATKFDPYIRLTLPIRDQAKTRTLGYFTSIPAKSGSEGGFFVSIALPDDLARAIDDLL